MNVNSIRRAGEELERRAAGAMGRDVEKLLLDQQAREAARSDQKLVWRALALATSGALELIRLLQTHTIKLRELPEVRVRCEAARSYHKARLARAGHRHLRCGR